MSYRREDAPDARSVRAGLQKLRLRVFLDVENLGPGPFNEQLFQCISNTPNYVIILSQNSLDQCSDENDWLRREIAHALKTNRKIIPINMPGFKLPARLDLPEDIRDLVDIQSISYNHEYFDNMIERIMKFLDQRK